jgi:glycosyltransferase involved in cell wall biosynthesis
MHNLSADISLFNKVNIEVKINAYPKKIVYIGRFSPEKGLKYLLQAWEEIEDKNDWTLTLIGNGPEKEMLVQRNDVVVLDFMSQELLVEQLQNAGCFILPSIFEPWALVLHEAAAAGLPILASDICGAVPYFVLNGFNSVTFRPGNIEQIKIAIKKIVFAKESDLLEMSYNSRKLAQRITPEIVAKTFLSVLKN